jgi:hypothetical protein
MEERKIKDWVDLTKNQKKPLLHVVSLAFSTTIVWDVKIDLGASIGTGAGGVLGTAAFNYLQDYDH